MFRSWLLLLSWALSLVLCHTPSRAAEPEDPPESEGVPQEARGKLALALDPGGHTARFSKILFTPDGKHLLTSSLDHVLRIWDVDTGEPLRVLYPPGGSSHEFFAVSPNGRILAIASSCGSGKDSTHVVALAAFADGQVERVLPCRAPVTSLAFSPDGQRLAVAANDKTIRVWDLAKEGAAPALQMQTSCTEGLAFSPDGRQLVCFQRHPSEAAILDLASGKEVVKIKEPLSRGKGKMWGVGWSPDSNTVATATESGLYLWEPTGKLRKHLYSSAAAMSVAFSPDSRRVLITTGYTRPLTTVFDIQTGKEAQHFDPGDTRSHHYGVFSPDGKLAATAGWGGIHLIFLWNTETGKLVHRLGVPSWLSLDDVNAAGWSADGQTICWKKGKKGAAGHEAGSFHLTRLKLEPPLEPAKVLGAVLEDGPLSLKKVDATTVQVLKTVAGGVSKTPKPKMVQATLLYPEHLTKMASMTLVGKDRAALAKTGSGKIMVYDLHSGKPLPHHLHHRDGVVSLAPAPHGGRYLLSLSLDQKLRIWDPERKEPLLSLYVSGRDWIAWTPEGYYAASAGGERLMGWVVENGPDQMSTFHPASRFRARLYRPDVIKLLLKEGSLDKALKKADEARGQVTKQVEISQVLPPQVKVTTSARPGTALKDGKLTIVAEASPVGADPITALQLLIDDRPYTGDKGLITFEKPQAGPAKATWQVELPKGQHSIRVLARTGASLGTSRGMELVSEQEKTEPKKEPTLYLLSVGINAYADKGLTLGGAVNDAKELEKVFQKYSSPLFPKIIPRVVVDKDATRKGILDGLAWLKQNMTASDLAVFFFAGHGDLDTKTKEFYLLPQDVNPKNLADTGLSRAELKKAMQGIPGRVLVVLDACHSGAVGVLFEDVSRELVDEDCGVIVVCAATPREVALEKIHGHLTRSVIEGLSGKAPNRNGSVFLSHLRVYVEDRVIELSNDKQHPVMVVPPWMRPVGLSKP